MTQAAFDFGQNWKEFSERALTKERYAQAQHDFAELTAGITLQDHNLLDIGFGQGLTLLCAIGSGAKVYGLDINPKCRDVFHYNRDRLRPEDTNDAQVAVGSILDTQIVGLADSWRPGGYDIVHSWGVLHHTGRMWQAIENAASLVRPGGHFILAIYNRHWSSPLWTAIKRIYVSVPRFFQKLMDWLFVPIIYIAKLIATRRNPLQMERGMEFYYNVVDWVGGYPYEYASREEIEAFLHSRGFKLERFVPTIVPIGCNEFIFRKLDESSIATDRS